MVGRRIAAAPLLTPERPRMSRGMIQVTDRLADYIRATTLREPPLLARLRAETMRMPRGGMQISPEQGQLMALLVELTGATRYLEIGTFTGYSSLALALAMPAEGRLTCCDMSAEWTAIARRYWEEGGVAAKVDLQLGPGIATLDRLIAAGAAGSYDIAFIDANKEDYDGYYERALTLLRPRGLVLIDNVLWRGDVADPANQTRETETIRALNAKIRDDGRVTMSLIAMGDGLLLALKRA